jgi:hypothetical protein
MKMKRRQKLHDDEMLVMLMLSICRLTNAALVMKMMMMTTSVMTLTMICERQVSAMTVRRMIDGCPLRA